MPARFHDTATFVEPKCRPEGENVKPLHSLVLVGLVIAATPTWAAEPNGPSLRWHFVEADNGAIAAVAFPVLHNANGTVITSLCMSWDPNAPAMYPGVRGGCVFDSLVPSAFFDCRGHYTIGAFSAVAPPRSIIGAMARIACGQERPAAGPDDSDYVDRMIEGLKGLAELWKIPSEKRAQAVAYAAKQVETCIDSPHSSQVGGAMCDAEIENWAYICKMDTLVEVAGNEGERALKTVFDAKSPDHAALLREWAARCSPDLWRGEQDAAAR